MDVKALWKLLSYGRMYGEAECKKHNFDCNNTNAKICTYLLSHPGVSQYDIASAYHIEASTVAKALSRLEIDGSVARTINPRDKRERVVTLTSQGRITYGAILQIQDKWEELLTQCLTPEENAEFDRLCHKTLHSVEELIFSENESR